MCRDVRVDLSEAERRAVRRFAGRLVPVYAVALLLVLGLSLLHQPPPRAPGFAAAPEAPATAR